MKRPLMGVSIALTVGVAVGWSDIPVVWIIILWITISVILKKWAGSSYKYMLGLSVFFLVGLCRMMECETSDIEMKDAIYGQVYKVQEKEKVFYLYVRNEMDRSVLAVIPKTDSNPAKYYKGQVYFIAGDAEKFENPGNPGQFDEAAYYRSQGISYRIWAKNIEKVHEGTYIYRAFRWLEYLKDAMCQFYEMVMDGAGAGVLQAAVLGERSSFDGELKQYYQDNGWMHLVTTSGLHLSFVAMNAYKRMRKITIPQGISTAIALCLMLAYGYMTDFGDSMFRAMGMMILRLMASVAGRKMDTPTGLASLAAIMLFLRPERLLSSGFLLTYAAVGGMELGQWIYRQRAHEKWKKSLYIQLGIFLTTLPILLWYIYEIPVLGFFYNFFMIPLISIIVPMGFILGVFGALRIPVLAEVSKWILKGIGIVLGWLHQLPSKTWVCGRPAVWQLALFVFAVFIGVWLIDKQKVIRGWSVLIICCAFLMFVRVRDNEIIFIDVGQGDGICILTDKGQAVLVDGGSSDVKDLYTYRLEPLLKYYGIDTIDGWFLTHGDSDHISGIKEALENNANIEQIFFPEVEGDEVLEEIKNTANEKNINTTKIGVGDKVKFGQFEMTCLYPSGDWSTGDSNNDSLILQTDFVSGENKTSILLTGDIEEYGEAVLMNNAKLEKVDILKVAHHGSSGGTTALLLEMLQPEWGIISCGEDNRYGHPHRETLERLENVGCKWLTTAQEGAIHIRLRSEGYTILGHQKKD